MWNVLKFGRLAKLSFQAQELTTLIPSIACSHFLHCTKNYHHCFCLVFAFNNFILPLLCIHKLVATFYDYFLQD